ncbi:MAG: hypothetical protein IJ371_00340 [Clostridia bacterium]|nr:hypothetical protein [Clostridia bacterium]
MGKYILDFVGVGGLTFNTLSDVLTVIIYVYAGLYALKIIMMFISSIFPNSRNSIFRGL